MLPARKHPRISSENIAYTDATCVFSPPALRLRHHRRSRSQHTANGFGDGRGSTPVDALGESQGDEQAGTTTAPRVVLQRRPTPVAVLAVERGTCRIADAVPAPIPTGAAAASAQDKPARNVDVGVGTAAHNVVDHVHAVIGDLSHAFTEVARVLSQCVQGPFRRAEVADVDPGTEPKTAGEGVEEATLAAKATRKSAAKAMRRAACKARSDCTTPQESRAREHGRKKRGSSEAMHRFVRRMTFKPTTTSSVPYQKWLRSVKKFAQLSAGQGVAQASRRLARMRQVTLRGFRGLFIPANDDTADYRQTSGGGSSDGRDHSSAVSEARGRQTPQPRTPTPTPIRGNTQDTRGFKDQTGGCKDQYRISSPASPWTACTMPRMASFFGCSDDYGNESGGNDFFGTSVAGSTPDPLPAPTPSYRAAWGLSDICSESDAASRAERRACAWNEYRRKNSFGMGTESTTRIANNKQTGGWACSGWGHYGNRDGKWDSSGNGTCTALKDMFALFDDDKKYAALPTCDTGWCDSNEELPDFETCSGDDEELPALVSCSDDDDDGGDDDGGDDDGGDDDGGGDDIVNEGVSSADFDANVDAGVIGADDDAELVSARAGVDTAMARLTGAWLANGNSDGSLAPTQGMEKIFRARVDFDCAMAHWSTVWMARAAKMANDENIVVQ